MRKPILRFYFPVIFFLLSVNLARGQNSILFDTYSVEDGLSNSSVKSFCQTKDGYIWIATTDGLNRFDGTKFLIHRKEFGEKNSLPGNYLSYLLVDTNDNIWIGTLSGLSLFDHKRQLFKNFLKDSTPNSISDNFITCLAKDKQGSIWAGTNEGGLNKVEFVNGNYLFKQLKKGTNGSISSNNVHQVVFDSKNNGYVLNSRGVDRLTIRGSEISFQQIIRLDPNSQIIYSIAIENDSVLWLGSDPGLLYRVSLHPENPLINLKELNPLELSSKNFSFFTNKSYNSEIWWGSFDTGILRIKSNFISGKFSFTEEYYKHESDNPYSLVSNQVYCMFEDAAGSMWIGSDLGISVYSKTKQQFHFINKISKTASHENITIWSIQKYNNKIFAGTDDNGLIVFDNNDIAIQNLTAENFKPGLSSNAVTSIIYENNKSLFLGTFNGITELKNYSATNSKNNFNTTYYLSSKNSADSIETEVYCMLKTSILLAGTNQGLYSIVPGNNGERKITKITSLKDEIVECMIEDVNKNIWVGTATHGIFILDANFKLKDQITTDSKNIFVSDNTINFLFQSSDKKIWAGTNGGLVKLDLDSYKTTIYSVKDGLPANAIYSILEDNVKNLWITTSSGIARFNSETETFTLYTKHDGLLSDNFTKGAAYKDERGNLFFGNIKGLIYFNPIKFKENNFIPPVVVTDFKIFGKSILADQNERRANLFIDKKIILKGKENSFSVEFAALNYINPANNKYKYKLEAFDEDWVDAGTHNYVYYTNIPPGNYCLLILGSNNSGVWNPVPEKLEVIISPTLFQQTWFKILLAFILALVIYYIYRQRIRAIEFKKEAEIADHSAKMKEQFLANMSHEIRTPLNAISGMANLLLKKPSSNEQHKYINAIHQSSENLNVIINDILDFSKIEAGKFSIERIDFSVRDVMENLAETLKLKATEKGIAFNVTTMPDVPVFVSGDPVRLAQILINLTGNSIKFTEKGFVSVTCKVVSKEEINNFNEKDKFAVDLFFNTVFLHFEVKDSGIGIPDDKIEKVFESFSQASVDISRRFGGTGLGLTITKKLIELHNGKLKVESRVGHGSVFSFILPYRFSDKTEKENEPTNNLEIDSLKGIKVLLVEDNMFNQIVAVDTLKNEIEEIEVDVASNGREALDKLRIKHYDIVLMDVQMPVMDGLEATGLIRTALPSPTNKIPILAMTAGALKSEIDNCMSAGMNDFITKPFNVTDLLTKIYSLINSHTHK